MSVAAVTDVTDFRMPAPTHTSMRAEAEQQAEHLIRSILCMEIRHTLEAAVPAEWEAGMVLLESEQPYVQRRGILALLHVLATTPNPAYEVAQHIYCQIQDAH
jgi:hypothetical protein